MYIVAKGEWGGNIPGFLNTQVSTEHIRDTGSEKCSDRYIPCMDVNCQVSLTCHTVMNYMTLSI